MGTSTPRDDRWIYPQRATFVEPIPQPQGNKQTRFHHAQVCDRKHVERDLRFCKPHLLLFVVQVDFGTKNALEDHTTCVVLHNMIIKNERDQDFDHHYDFM
jgi:hypothetical protein